ncbi:hypothetical protein E2C01_082216 [Portunus trituberculatus]|uniref:Uncharacterized protein n=1 Tax=Portunus trituberculatus TaxID=210409 RepID=A0A5B7IXV8_PORTR|nr:hypothetical protein [Portunus trituberculatus]
MTIKQRANSHDKKRQQTNTQRRPRHRRDGKPFPLQAPGAAWELGLKTRGRRAECSLEPHLYILIYGTITRQQEG